MILDNKNTNLKVHEWIAQYTKEGIFNLVTRYFTIGVLAYLSDKINEKIPEIGQPLTALLKKAETKNLPKDSLRIDSERQRCPL